MSRYEEIRSPRERHEVRYTRSPPMAERPRRVEDDRFEFRLREEERYGPPARRPERRYEEDDFLVYTNDPDRRVESPPPRPRLLRRQSSLDTFDRIPPRRREDAYYYDRPKIAIVPSPPRRYSPSPRRYERDYYEDIRIAEPDYYGDDEYRDFRDRDSIVGRRRRSNSTIRYREDTFEEIVEKPYPRRGKTRIPRRLIHTRAIIELGYPFQEEDDKIVILKALSKDQIDQVISLSRDIKRRSETRITYRRTSPSPRRRVLLDSHTPRSSRDTLIVESPSRHRSRSRHHRVKTVSYPRSVSVRTRDRRHSSPPPRVVERRDREVVEESGDLHVGPITLFARPRNEDDDLEGYIRELEEEQRSHRSGRRGGVEIVHNTEIIDDDGEQEKIVEVRKDRKGRRMFLVRHRR